MRKLLIIGASGHGKVVADIAKKNKYDDIAFLDDNEDLSKCGNYNIIGKCSRFEEFDCDMFVAIGNAEIRERLQNMLEEKGKIIPALIHPNAVIAENVSVGAGTVIMPGAVVNPDSIIGKGCIINTCSSVDHDCIVENFAHISVGAHLAGTVTVGEKTWVGIGAVVSNNLKIADNCMIGAGATVIHNIEESGTYVGVPAKKI